MYESSSQVDVKAIEENKRILVEWSAFGSPTTIEWTFDSRRDHTTLVSITNSGYAGDDDEIVRQALASTEGFAIVLAGLKAFLEHDVIVNLVADRFPKALD